MKFLGALKKKEIYKSISEVLSKIAFHQKLEKKMIYRDHIKY